MIIYLSKNPRALYNYGKPTLLLLFKWNNKRLNEAHLLTTRFTEKFLLIVESYYSGGKKNPFKILLFTGNVSGYPIGLMEMYNKIHVFFFLMPANKNPINK